MFPKHAIDAVVAVKISSTPRKQSRRLKRINIPIKMKKKESVFYHMNVTFADENTITVGLGLLVVPSSYLE